MEHVTHEGESTAYTYTKSSCLAYSQYNSQDGSWLKPKSDHVTLVRVCVQLYPTLCDPMD